MACVCIEELAGLHVQYPHKYCDEHAGFIIHGQVTVDPGDGHELLLSDRNACPDCDLSFPELTPSMFSFNSPAGMCPECNGLGETRELDMDLIIPDPSKSINEEGLAPLGKPRSTWVFSQLRGVGRKYGFDFDTPLKKLSRHAREVLLQGGGDER